MRSRYQNKEIDVSRNVGKPMTYEEVKEFVDAFPDFLEELCRLSK